MAPPTRVDASADLSSSPASKRQKSDERPSQSSLTNFFPLKQTKKKSPNNNNNNNNGDYQKDEASSAAHPTTKQDTTTSSSTATTTTTTTTTDPSSSITNESPGTIDPILLTPVNASISTTNASWSVYREACLVRRLRRAPPDASLRTKLAAFDLDGTLLTWRISGWPSRMEHYELWNRAVLAKLRHLYDAEGYQLAIFSNQGAIRGAFEGKKATHVKALVEWLCHTIDRPVSVVVMSTNKKSGYHKPSANMWKVAEQCCCKNNEEWDVRSSFYVGDSIEHEDDPQGGVDVGFARNVGEVKGATLHFYTPEEYFGDSHQELRKKHQRLAYTVPPQEALGTRAALTGGYLEGPILLIMVGVQGSGKSTFCQTLVQRNKESHDYGNEKGNTDWVHLSQDTINDGAPGTRWAVEEAAQAALQRKQSVVVDRMHLDETQREHFIRIAQDAGVPVHAVVLSPPKKVIEERVRERENHEGGVQGDSGAKLAMHSSDKMVKPKYEEGLALISITRTAEGAARLAECYRKLSLPSNVEPICSASRSFSLSSTVSLPSITFGTMGLGRKKAQGIASKAIQLGFEAFDTAPTYKNEDKLGKGLDGDSSSFFTVKVPKRATSAAQVRQELTDSLSNLNLQRADLLLLHWPAEVIATEVLQEVWSEMESCQTEGLVRALGVSNFNAEALLLLLTKCNIQPLVNQIERHPLLPQWELVDFCAQNDILIQAHSPLAQGSDDLLSHEIVQQVANRNACSAAQVVLKWNIQQGVAVVPKCRSEEHMRDVLSSRTSSDLSAADMKALNQITERKRFVAPPFMYGKEPYCWGESVPK